MIDAAGGEPTRLTSDAAMNTQPQWAASMAGPTVRYFTRPLC
ncbi:MAG: hypothetical protein R2911_35345 [Caldilineaceae bacterium]